MPKEKSTKRVAKKVAKAVVKRVEKKAKKQGVKKKRLNNGSLAMSACCNTYLQSLLDPFTVRGARIPDQQVMPSVTLSTYDKIAFSASTLGYFAIRLDLKPPFTVVPGSTLQPFDRGDQTAAPTNVITYSGANATGDNVWQGPTTVLPYSATAALNQNYSLIRPVSAELRVYYIGATIEDSGIMNAASVSAQQYKDLSTYDGVAGGLGSFSQPFNGFLTWPTAAAVPINATRVIACRYLPPDEMHQMYSDGYVPYFGPAGATEDWMNWWTSYIQQPPYWYGTLMVGGEGLAASAPLYADIVVNWEAIPWRNTYTAGDARVSTSDPLLNSNALNISAAVPPVKANVPATMPSTEPAMSFTDGGLTTPAAQGAANIARAVAQVNPVIASSPSATTTTPSLTKTEPSFLDKALSFVPQVTEVANKVLGGSGKEGIGGLIEGAAELLPALL